MSALAKRVRRLPIRNEYRYRHAGEKSLFAKWLAGIAPAGATCQVLRSPASPVQFLPHRNQAFMHGIERKNVAHLGGFGLINKETPSFGCHLVAQRRCPTDPLSLPPGRRKFVARPLSDDLPLELGK
jgi:hypothetical protein